ncbi:MAG: dihydropteroate synthase [Candidatus Rokubacteria bacterium]|nr:dihydropteroate synthase [Candidatus Rokubacteria bacterium]MBI2879282.1 dihydropteroate synthase [Candidatus Rokubacteria bacterium]
MDGRSRRPGRGGFREATVVILRARDRRLDLGFRTRLMGILNVTPDSFAEVGRVLDPGAAVAYAVGLARAGADIIDVGAESTRPGSRGISAGEELDRVLPVLEGVLKAVDCLVSVDTSKPEVAEAALALGVHMVNDVTALRAGPAVAERVARHGAGLVLMHMRGTPATMQLDPRYDDLLGEVSASLREAVAVAEAAGVRPDAIAVDPGIGFGKTVAHNLTLVKRLDAFRALGKPLVVGPSRKSFIGAILDLPTGERLEGTLAACCIAAWQGAHILRVHDVAAARRAALVVDAIRAAPEA